MKLGFLPLAAVMLLPALHAAPLYIAHRGSSGEAPENTLAAFKLAGRQLADGVECDIHRTRDNRLVICHDPSTKRTTGVDLKISESNLAELRRLDAGKFKGEEFKGETLPQLSELLRVVMPEQLVYIELKEDDPLILPLVKEELKKSRVPMERIRLISFHPSLLKLAKEQMPDCKTYYLRGLGTDRATGRPTPSAEELIRLARAINADGLDLGRHPKLDAELVKAIRDGGLELHVWTVDSPMEALRYAALGVDSITTNYPKRLKDSAGRQGRGE
ncbi:glycerophosphodiester phosphodiesterase [Victivallis vadensis]|uniref:glycerophosphodiester phosphodiesterase n=1 Tax=Victivallis vadensis TaxID=172901 RepID=UPI00266BB1B7|nr:glycerophosphodiester phosphodiesterase [Victivallis vadensis]